jgi:hypothetical protein
VIQVIPIISKIQGPIQLSQGHTEQSEEELVQDKLYSHCPKPVPRTLPTWPVEQKIPLGPVLEGSGQPG